MPSWKVDFGYRLNVNDQKLMADVARVQAMSRIIHGIPLPPAVQMRIDQLNILRAVRGTTGIEGTEVSESEVEQIMLNPPDKRVLPANRQRAEQEVRNAEKVMQFVASFLRENPDHPINENLIRTIHELTTDDIDYADNVPGEYRNHAVHVGTYVPPRTGEEVRTLMKQFVEWFREGPPRGWPAPVRAAMGHFYLIGIHPFGDGNGRTARGLESFLLYQGGINARGFYSLANFYYQNRDQYVGMLDHTRFESNGDLTPFAKFVLGALVDEQEAVHQEILGEVTIIAFRDFARETLSRHGKLATRPGERMFRFLLALPDQPVSMAQLRKGGHPLSVLYSGMTSKTITRDLNYLRKHELIVVEGDRIRANIEVMKQFMPPAIPSFH